MADKLFKTYLPALSMAFTLIIIIAGIVNWIHGENQSSSIYFTFEVFTYLVITCIVDGMIRRIDFKTYIGHFIVESILIYPITMFFAVKFRWFDMSIHNILFYSVLYFIVMMGIHIYIYNVEKSWINEINRLLEVGRGKNG